ncbi:hypothetical protein [Flavobacterium sp. NRK1]|uniref:hypothetical protein n=1 Tax=Flavobacterium sp. NRK1 TaxID=2954929 RepID=UPI002092B800|nr:hypothetical protein [Flavobacterium sp. NRK1]MCO6149572.1 hypothetical protein [Flavobacterium sp. NRK1]
MYIKKLNSIVKSILKARTESDIILSTQLLSSFYNEINIYNLSDDNQITIKGGVALSGLHAANCLDDYMRTALFLKGTFKAITKLHNLFPRRPVNILYAGTGPYATLLLPLLTQFNKINIIFLDINDTSIKFLKKLISILGLENLSYRFIIADATTYNIPSDFIVDLVITETMHYGLTSEPQVAIVKNIMSQTPSHTMLIPQEIHIDLAYTYFAKEPFLKNNPDALKGCNNLQPYEHRKFVDRLFTIQKDLFKGFLTNATCITSKFYNLPLDFTNSPDICVFTTITIFEDIVLKTAESLITNPYCITSIYNLRGFKNIQLTYDFSEVPKWIYNVR